MAYKQQMVQVCIVLNYVTFSQAIRIFEDKTFYVILEQSRFL